jgi:hypothetical protein
MQAVARLERIEARRQRGSSRLKLGLGVNLTGSGEEVVVHDLSATGILIETAAKLRRSARIEVELPEVGATVATVVWRSGGFFGCEFAKPIPKAALSAALLRNPFEAPAVAQPSEISFDEGEDAAEFVDDRAPFAVRMRVILGSAILLWALILWAAGVL